jgi:hypothetical protein
MVKRGSLLQEGRVDRQRMGYLTSLCEFPVVGVIEDEAEEFRREAVGRWDEVLSHQTRGRSRAGPVVVFVEWGER